MGTYLADMPRCRSSAASVGHLIIVSSIVGKRGVLPTAAYSATKFAQVGLAESLRRAAIGIHVTIVYPIPRAPSSSTS
jgi:NAD(P)-dependent dehydrogenase (short-subunit alcohol dehydrogenase family)